jgi:tetratricopeptide (TPR) repeat protein
VRPIITLAAAANLVDGPIAEARAALRNLARHSLVDEHLPGRWQMRDLVRLHAAKESSWIHTPEERRDALRRLVHFFLHTAHRAAGLLDPSRRPVELGSPPAGCAPQRPADSAAALEWFEIEHPGLLAVQRLAVEHAWDEQVWQLAPALSTFHSLRGRVHDDLAVWRLALSAAERLDDPVAKALSHRCLGDAYARSGDFDQALEHLRIALLPDKATKDVRGQGDSYRILGRLWAQRGDDELASEYAALAEEAERNDT